MMLPKINMGKSFQYKHLQQSPQNHVAKRQHLGIWSENHALGSDRHKWHSLKEFQGKAAVGRFLARLLRVNKETGERVR